MYRRVFVFLTLIFCFALSGLAQKTISQRVDSLLRLMTLEEKIGQMNQYSSDFAATGPITPDGEKQEQVRKGMIGSFLNITGAERTRSLQEIALQSRRKIPLLFGQDVIHGYRTTFPIPLAEAASWDLSAIERSARIAAIEASAAGIHWLFAPMVDIARDPRWGRIMEGAGEDPFLGSLIAAARVKGFQGKGLGQPQAVMACVKHYAAYGAAVGGRDYNSVDMSLRQLHETYLPPFKAAAEAGAATFMNSFNDLNGIPATGNAYLLREVLKKQWHFTGFVVSDWGSVGEMIAHGYAKDNADAAMLAANAGSDMDMESRSYIQHLAQQVKSGKVKPAVIDEAVSRILRKKFELGLFDNPFRFCNEEEEKKQFNNAEHLSAAKQMAQKSIVLLKNDTLAQNGMRLLPLSRETKKIAFVGPLVKSVREHLGFWSFDWPDDTLRIASLWNAVQAKISGNSTLLYAKGCNLNDTVRSGFAEARRVAEQADVVVVYVGETRDMAGEARSRSNLHLPGVQEELVNTILATGKPVVLLIGAGRPLVFNTLAEKTPAILYTWWLGIKAGEAIADVLFGDYNPSGRLPVSFPRSEGQIPVYYNYFSTGRPAQNELDVNYVSAYTDLPNSPQYVFGFGLSYSRFMYGRLSVNKSSARGNDTVIAGIRVANISDRAGEETVQLYICDEKGSVVRPVKELKGFQKIWLNPGETKTVSFRITPNDLKFYNADLKYDWEPGEFTIMIGANSRDVKSEPLNWSR